MWLPIIWWFFSITARSASFLLKNVTNTSPVIRPSGVLCICTESADNLKVISSNLIASNQRKQVPNEFHETNLREANQKVENVLYTAVQRDIPKYYDAWRMNERWVRVQRGRWWQWWRRMPIHELRVKWGRIYIWHAWLTRRKAQLRTHIHRAQLDLVECRSIGY